VGDMGRKQANHDEDIMYCICVEPSVGVSSGPYGTPKFWFQDAVQDAVGSGAAPEHGDLPGGLAPRRRRLTRRLAGDF
jgi:hypothetical protein